MDGVLFDTIEFARKSFLKKHPGMTEKMYDELHSGNFHEEARKYEHLKVKMSEDEARKYFKEYNRKKSESYMFEGMQKLLNDLHAGGYFLALNTNASESNCYPLLEKAGIKDLFDFIACAEVSKDKVEKFRMIAEKFSAQKKDMVFVTDALGDVKDAERAGVTTIAVTFGVHDRSYFEHEEHPYLMGVADTPHKLTELLHQWLAA